MPAGTVIVYEGRLCMLAAEAITTTTLYSVELVQEILNCTSTIDNFEISVDYLITFKSSIKHIG